MKKRGAGSSAIPARAAATASRSSHFAARGEERELVELGYKVCEGCPRLYELGQRAWDAKRKLLEEWRDADARDEEESDE